MAVRRSIKGTQPHCRVMAVRVDGSAVTTSAATTGMLGPDRHNMTIAKGSGGTANEVTIVFNKAFKEEPVVQATSVTTNCHVEIKSISTTTLVLETFQVADGTTGVNDADLHVTIMGWDTTSEYKVD